MFPVAIGLFLVTQLFGFGAAEFRPVLDSLLVLARTDLSFAGLTKIDDLCYRRRSC